MTHILQSVKPINHKYNACNKYKNNPDVYIPISPQIPPVPHIPTHHTNNNLSHTLGGRWMIGTPEDNAGGIETAETGLVLPPVSGWEYYTHDGEWIPDQHLTVQGK